MFTIDATIDTIQNSKKQFVKTFVTNEKMAQAMNNFIDAQTEYTKDAVKAGSDTAVVVGQEIVRNMSQLTKVDLHKMSETMVNSVKYMVDSQKNWLNSLKV